MKKIVLFIVFGCIFGIVQSQEMPVYDEYHLNKALINPAIIGSEGCTWIKGTDMHQWLGMHDAPQIQTVSIEASVQSRKALRETDQRVHGLGAFIYRDRNGAYKTIGAQLSYAYHVFISKNRGIKLGMGLSFRMFMASLDESGFKGDPDPAITGGVSTVFKPDAGAGLFVYNDRFYVGLSVAQIFNTSYSIASERHYYLIAGFLTGKDKDRYRWLPSIAFKTTEDLRKQIDANLKMIMQNSWWLGAGYRQILDNLPGQALSVIPMVGFTKGNLSVMYALVLNPGKIQMFNYGTHEFMVSWRFCKDACHCPVYQ